MYFNDCPRQPFIPIYLCGFIVFFYVFGLFCCRKRAIENVVCCSFMTAVLFFCWFIAGNVMIYSIYDPNYKNTQHNTTEADSYCDKTLYLFAFWSTNFIYILLGLIILCSCCVFYCGPQDVSPPV
ncbi:transmembrane protein 272-like [Scomber japonicus]|uniref:transmembrane protein 272-like n=1 Tax=Scomber japonicus TaxID=13676 RepID=UPI002306B269|nr:transmembrane protein 272-like [Scomber japonicus]